MQQVHGVTAFQPLEAPTELALDLANTIRGTDEQASDLLDSPGALGRWVELASLGDPDEGVLLRLPEFRALRAAVRDLLAAQAAGEPLTRAAVDAVNRASAAVPSFPRLDLADPSAPTAVAEASAASPINRMLAAVARSAIALLADDRARIRRCPAPGCGRYFVAGREGQVWCSAACGNRARVARHHERRRASLQRPSAPA
ncbi:MAG TPA: ABATE domain-containing protein [Actinomycetota bacterium]|nr:ABATE domain-containing protein [Actinomycetota bacterium]